MKNQNAILINSKLGAPIYNELILDRLELNKLTKKRIKEMMIDDLINTKNEPTPRLMKFVNEILTK